MRQLPSSWAWASLADIASWGSGGTPTAGDPRFYGGEIPWAVIGDLNDAIVTETANSITDEGLASSSAKVVPEGALLIAMYGSIGKLGVAGRAMATNQAIAFARADKRIIESRYLFWYLSSERNNFMHAGKGATQKNISQTVLKSWPIPVPPLPEQRRIVATLDDHLSRLDAARYELDKTVNRSARLHADIRESLLSPWSTKVTQFGLTLREPLANGRSVQTNPHGFPVLRLTALRDGYLDLNERKGGEWTLEDAKLFLVRKGDFFISRGNGSLSRVGRGALLAIEPDPVAFPDTLIRARVNELHVLPDFLRLIWDSRGIRRQVEGAARTTAGIYKINQQIIEQLRIPIPPLQSQERIIAEFDAISSKVLHAKYATVSSAKRADKLRTSLLAEAFSGRLVMQDPADEPASLLLDRIRAERVAQPGAGRGRGRAKPSKQKEMLL